jgi:hypothetical protein
LRIKSRSFHSGTTTVSTRKRSERQTGVPMRWSFRDIDWTAIVASALVLAFGILVLVPAAFYIDHGGQPQYEHGAASTGDQSVQDIAAQGVAYYTEMLAWFTAVLAVASTAQGIFLLRAESLTRQSVKLAREEFNATHRPRVYIQDTRPNWDDSPVGINYTLINAGSAPCRIVRSILVAQVLSRFDQAENFRPADTQNDIGPMTLAPGQFVDATWLRAGPNFAVALAAADQETMSGQVVHFAGCIVYEDAAGLLRRMVFRRSYDPETRRFKTWRNDPEFEWTD